LTRKVFALGSIRFKGGEKNERKDLGGGINANTSHIKN